MSRNTIAQYPSHLARLVSARLKEWDTSPPPPKVMLSLLETLYFASLKTDEQRLCRCSVDYVEPNDNLAETIVVDKSNSRSVIRFRQRIPLNVRSLTKLADAADPAVSSLAVYHDENGDLFIWGMLDQELRYGNQVVVDSHDLLERAGLFQATITGVGSISVFKDNTMLGSLEQNSLIAAYHDVLWQGPVHKRLRANLSLTLAGDAASRRSSRLDDVAQVKDELIVRWQNAICRLLLNIQQYGHGGGLLIVPRCPAEHVNVKYQIRYDSLPRALFDLARHQLLKRRTSDTIAEQCQTPADVVPCDMHYDALEYQNRLEEHKREALTCARFIASLSRVDGFVMLDRSLVVHGFGVETRAESDLTEVYTAADAKATPRMLRQATLSQFGTRHRAMMRYCHQHEQALGFVISQDGDIRATMKIKDRLVLWENINVQIGFRRENQVASFSDIEPVNGLFHFWGQSLANLP